METTKIVSSRQQLTMTGVARAEEIEDDLAAASPASKAFNRVRPMYTSDIENRQHRSLLEHRRIGVGKAPMSML